MTPIFLSIDARRRDAWGEAFPGLAVGRLDSVPPGKGIVWALHPQGETVVALTGRLHKHVAGRPLVILSDTPSDDDALAALAAGAAGYCNGHAAPQVLQQVARAVEVGGIWVGQGLMQRLLAATARAVPVADAQPWREALTAREQEAALLLAKGASNKEIARELGITERTVKAHVAAMLDKLGARDRLQLALMINGVGNPR